MSDTASPAADGGSEDIRNAPLAPFCSLCGDGYNPNLKIVIHDQPRESSGGNKEHQWCHQQCKRDHEAIFLEATPEDGWDVPPTEDNWDIPPTKQEKGATKNDGDNDE